MMIRTLLALLAVTAAPLAAQPGQVNREALQRQIVQRFMENFRNQAGLTDGQYDRFRDVVQRSFRERRELEARQRELIRALEGQLRPGVAADEDSLTAIMASMSGVRQELVDLARRDQEEFGEFLSPVQQGQLILNLERFQQQIETLLRRRGQPQRPSA